MIFARAGEQIMDDGGNLYATVARDFEYKNQMNQDDLMFQGAAPKTGDRVPEFAKRWYRSRWAEIRGNEKATA